jgi:hypothetical protein
LTFTASEVGFQDATHSDLKAGKESSNRVFDGRNSRALKELCIDIAPKIRRHLRFCFTDYEYSILALCADKVARLEYYVISWRCFLGRPAASQQVVLREKKNTSGATDASFFNLIQDSSSRSEVPA